MLKNKSKTRYFIEFVVLVALITCAELLPDLLHNTRLVFFCRDPNLSYPLRRPTFSIPQLYLIVFTVPSVVIFLNEALVLRRRGRLVNWIEVRAFFVYIYHLFYIIIFIAFCSKFAIDVVKATAGRLRPNFFAFCRPVNLTTRISILQTCTDGQLIEEYDCSNEEREAFLSFVSGHAAFVSVSFGITIIYIQYRILWSSVGLIKNLFQVALFLFGCFIGITRVTEHFHHPSDVLAGFLLGQLFVVICCQIVKEILVEEMQTFLRVSASNDKPSYDRTYSSIQTVY